MIDINNITPKSGFVVLEIVERVNNKIGNLYIPETALRAGRLIEGVVHKIGSNCDESLKIGQSVYFDIYSATYNEDNVVICKEEDIYGIIED